MMKGYLTVFLALSMSLLAGVILFLMGNAIRNGSKVRLEGAADTGMNAVLGEYGTALYDRYGLFYVDVSYLEQKPSVANLESRLTYYIGKNLCPGTEQRGFWGRMDLKETTAVSFRTAASGNGDSMKRQAAAYIRDNKIQREEVQIAEYMGVIDRLAQKDASGEWRTLMEQIAGMELPCILNEKGQWEEVALGNPADSVYGLLGSDILYLIRADLSSVGTESIRQQDYISSRPFLNGEDRGELPADDEQFLSYLFEKMGNYRRVREDSVLRCQLEYIIAGKSSDFENLEWVAEELMDWRFADNVICAFSDGLLYEEARAAARELYAVALKPEFEEPVARSILYACAYLETISDMSCLFAGGCTALPKHHLQTRVDEVLSGGIPKRASGTEGICYEQYLACMLMRLPEKKKNLRAMDIMEMDLRRLTGNPFFAMDWCIERFRAEILAEDGLGREYRLERTYGYY